MKVTGTVIRIKEFFEGFFNVESIDVARGCTGCTCTLPRAEKNFGPNLQGKVVSTPQTESAPHEAEQESIFFRKLGRFWRWERLLRQF